MIIERAIEAAKRRRQEAALRDVRTESSPSAPPQLPRKVTVEREPISTVTLQLDRIDYNRELCQKTRILVPNSVLGINSGALDAYGILRTRLSLLMRSKNWASLGITSPGPEEGKSVTSLNLALSLAREKSRNIFLVDLDLRSPRICSYLGVRPKTEIWTYFAGSSSADQLLFSIGVDNLAVAGGVFSTSASSELLGTGRLDELVAYIRTIDPSALILFDLPPVLNTADALVVAPSVDALLIVASVGKTRRDALANAVDVLSPFEVAGFVLNRSAEMVGEYYGS